ncbi:hypothetical protein H2203_001932 [Taxawa tesnikishii (nom. ined.)]|nr:hypothetical protein H2203_001932 [Dothideales sp. JES 119]
MTDFSFRADLHEELHNDRKIVADPHQPQVELQPFDGTSSSSASTKVSDLDGTPDAANKRDSALSGLAGNASDKPKRSGLSKRKRARKLGHDAKEKTKRILHLGKAENLGDNEDDIEGNPRQAIDDDPAFDPSKLTGQKHVNAGSTADKALGTLKASAKAVINPRSAAKRKAATKVAVQDRPYLSQENDLEYLQAHEDLSKAKSSAASSDETDEEEEIDVEETRNKVQALDALRESRKVAWMTGRHMYRARVIPKVDLEPPHREDFYVCDKDTGRRHFDRRGYFLACGRYELKSLAINNMGDVDYASQPPFDRDAVLQYVERILIASSPWQSWFSDLRKLYRWEDPARTRKWAVIWFLVWYMDFIMTFILMYTAYIVLENKYASKKVEDLRESYERAMDGNTRTFKFNELINRHGSDKWIDPLIEELGPIVQLQLADMADFLEILHNFYDWKVPEKTWATLFWFACAVSIGILTPSGYSWKIVYMFCYLSFFLSRPIASKQPQYRHVVNALRWIFWEIPTEPQWSMMYLRKKAQETRSKLIEKQVAKTDEEDLSGAAPDGYIGSLHVPDITRTGPALEPDADDDSDGASWHTADSSTSIFGGMDIMSFRCRVTGTQGRLIIYSDGLRFVRSAPFASMRKELWRHPWRDLFEIQKINSSPMSKVMTVQGMKLRFVDGSTVELQSVHGRDKAFNSIIGFSGLQLQILQPHMDEDSSGDRTAHDGDKPFD